MMFVKFPNYFDDNSQIQNLETIWLNDPEQRSAIFNWAMEGLQRLLSQGHFSVTKTQTETEIMFNRVTDNITAFQMENGIIDRNLTTTRADTLTAYQEYCEEIGVEPRKASQLTQGMQRLAPKVKDGFVNKPKHERAWIGFGLKNREKQQSLEQLEQLEQQNILVEYSENSKNNKKNKNGVLSVVTVLKTEQLNVVTEETGLRHIEVNPVVYEDRFCSVECENYDKQSCPYFTQKLPKDHLLPLKCYGFRASNRGEEVS